MKPVCNSTLSKSMKIADVIEGKIFSPPEVFLKLRDTMGDPQHTFSDLENILEADPVLTARLLKIANSVFYGFETKVESIKHALEIIGSEQLTNLVLSATVSDNFRMIPKDLLDMEAFWKHSLACGIGAKLLAEMKNTSDADSYYLAGLLHDIGSLIIYSQLPKKAVETIAYSRDTGDYLYHAEGKIIGFDHAAMGGALFKDWQLPPKVVEGVKYHHTPQQAKQFPEFCASIHIAEVAACNTRFGRYEEPQKRTFAPGILEKVNVSEKEVENIQSQLEGSVDETFQLFFG